MLDTCDTFHQLKHNQSQMSKTYQSLKSEELPEGLTTVKASALLNRAPQTLRKWACLEIGPIRPIRINGRLAWRVSDIQALLGGDS